MTHEIEKLFEQIISVREGETADEKTQALFEAGSGKIAKKVVEESTEVSLAYVQGNADEVVRETADLIYNLFVLLVDRGIRLEDIWEEMATRKEVLGIAGKVPKELRGDVAQQLEGRND